MPAAKKARKRRPSPPSRPGSSERVRQVQAPPRHGPRRFVVLSIALGLIVATIAAETYLHRLTSTERGLLSQAPALAAAGCSPVQVVRPYPNGMDRAHVGTLPSLQQLPPLSSYPSTPPVSGPHEPVPLGAGVYPSPPNIGQTIHSLEHAAVIIWYDPALASANDLASVRAFFQRSDEHNHVIVAPYDYPAEGDAGRLPAGRAMALAAWHRLRFCNQLSLPVAFDFVHRYRFNLWQRGAYQGDAPEKYSPI